MNRRLAPWATTELAWAFLPPHKDSGAEPVGPHSAALGGRTIAIDGLFVFLPVLAVALLPGGTAQILVVVSLVWVLVVRRVDVYPDFVVVSGAALVAVSLASSALGVVPDYSMRVATSVALSIAYALALRAYFAAHPDCLPYGLVALWVSGLIHTLYFTLGAQRRAPTLVDPLGRSALESVNANVSGWILAVGLWAGLFVVIQWRRRISRLLALAILLSIAPMAVALVATGSRTSLASASAGIAVLVLRRAPRLVHALTVGAWTAAVVVSMNPWVLRELARIATQLPVVSSFSQGRGTDGLNGRADLWLFMHDYALDLPPYGLGYGSYRLAHGEALTTHNFILEAWTGVGVVGLTLYLLWLGGLLLAPYGRNLTSQRDTYVLSASAFLVLLPTLLASTQHWTTTTAAVLGIAGVCAPRSTRELPWDPGTNRQPSEQAWTPPKPGSARSAGG